MTKSAFAPKITFSRTARLAVSALGILGLASMAARGGILSVGPITNSSATLIQPPDIGLTGSYTFTFNSGTLQPNVDPRTHDGVNGDYDEQTVLTGWGNGSTGGTLIFDSVLVPDGPQNLGSGVDYSISASFTGTGSMSVVARDPWNGALNAFGGLGFIVTSSGVTSLTIDILFDYAILPRSSAPLTGSGDAFQYGPYSSLTGYKTGVAGSQTDFGFSYTLYDQNQAPLYLTAPRFIDNRGGFPFPTLSPAGSQALWDDIRNNGSARLAYGGSFGIHDYGDGNTLDDYVGRISMTFFPVGGTEFEVGSQFNYSVDGDSPPGVPQVIPEPGVGALVLLTGLGMWRRRR